MHAAEVAQAADFIQAQPQGLQAFVAQGGTNFSGGQKQRLSIARALVKKPQLYIFDDSFSALDFKTDAALRKALKKRPRMRPSSSWHSVSAPSATLSRSSCFTKARWPASAPMMSC